MRKMLLTWLLICCCGLSACAARSGAPGSVSATALSAPALEPLPVPAGASLFVECEDKSGAGVDLQGILMALLQSDRGMRVADAASTADYVVRVTVVQAGLVNSQVVGMALADAAGPALLGTLGGAAVGGAVGGRSGMGWGAGIGLLVGLGSGYAGNHDNTAYTWALITDVRISAPPLAAGKTGTKADRQRRELASRVTATADGVNLNREDALPALESSVAQEIVRAFTEAK